jgi:hypothetical protein
MSRRTLAELQKDWVRWSYKIHDAGVDKDPLIDEAHGLLHEFSYMMQSFHTVCICTFCGAEYWCRDVGEVCPTCGANVSQADMLNWTISATDRNDDWTKHIWEEYRRRGDWPFQPKGSPEDLLKMEIRSFREELYCRIAQDHENYDHILRHSLVKIKWLKRKRRKLLGKSNKYLDEKVYECADCGWSGTLGEAYQNISGVNATWICPSCMKKMLLVINYKDDSSKKEIN